MLPLRCFLESQRLLSSTLFYINTLYMAHFEVILLPEITSYISIMHAVVIVNVCSLLCSRLSATSSTFCVCPYIKAIFHGACMLVWWSLLILPTFFVFRLIYFYLYFPCSCTVLSEVLCASSDSTKRAVWIKFDWLMCFTTHSQHMLFSTMNRNKHHWPAVELCCTERHWSDTRVHFRTYCTLQCQVRRVW